MKHMRSLIHLACSGPI